MLIQFPGTRRSLTQSASPLTAPPALMQMRGYWEGLRQGSRLPLRSEIDPRGIDGALEGAFLLERVAPTVARFRLAGMSLVDLMGMEVRGMPLSAMFAPADRKKLAEALQQVFATPATLDMTLEAERGIGKPALSARMLILPLGQSDDERPQALGCLALSGEIGRNQRRFHVSTLRHEVLPAAAHSLRQIRTAGMAEAAAGFAPHPTSTKPKLRLISFDT